MTHPLVLQLRFTRKEFVRGLKDVTADEAVKHFKTMNCISWIIGHLAWQEQLYWLTQPQGLMPCVATQRVREATRLSPSNASPGILGFGGHVGCLAHGD